MRRVAVKFVPKQLSCEQKELRLDIAQDMLECQKPDESYELFHFGYHQAFGKTYAVALFNAFRHCAQSKNAMSTCYTSTHWLPGSD
jgi:hypothetical protein